MAERLTEYFECGAYTEKQNIVDVSDKVKFFDNGCVMGKVIDKLAHLEDIMERLGINFVEDLEDEIKSLRVDKYIYKQYRDTWKRACELACEHIAEVEWFSCPETDSINESEDEIKTLAKQSLNYFYQQAKKEGNDE